MISFCKVCGEQFSHTSNQRTCSKECRKKVSRDRANAWYADNKEASKDRRATNVKDWRKNNPEKYLFNNAVRNGKFRNIEVSITIDDIVVPEECPILRTPFVYGTKYAASIDRIDNTKGYIPGNVWIISRLANVMKNEASLDELRKFADWFQKQSTVS